jgi:selenide,water dikinase
VYQLTPELAIIQTVDFFAPIVDDPFTFGRVAATNALSDVYAMGGRPITVMNIVGFPRKELPFEVLTEILKGGLEATKDAGAVLAGGHTVDDAELKYGLSVTGIVHPDKVLTNSGAQAGDQLILTKPLGTGIIATALKGDAAAPSAVDEMIRNMCTLNRAASEAMLEVGVHACTDVTGFGLLGHAWEMMKNSGVGLEIRSAEVPFMEGVLDYAAKGMVPGGADANKKYYGPDIRRSGSVGEDLYTALLDPQTSGGLLIAVPIDKAYALTEALKARGVDDAVKIGECTDQSGKIVLV